MKTTFTLLLTCCICIIFAQPGTLDPDFGGGDGIIRTSVLNNYACEGQYIATQEDGKILVAGYTKTSGQIDQAVLVRYLPDGTLDNTFNGNGKLFFAFEEGSAYGLAVVVQPDGKIVWRLLNALGDESTTALYRLLSDGSPDTSFNTDGLVILSAGGAFLEGGPCALQPDGKIVIGGYIKYGNAAFDSLFLARYNADGSPDAGFDDDGLVKTFVGESYVRVTSVLIQSDHKIIAVGSAEFDHNDDFIAVRYLQDGALDTSFDSDGIASLKISDEDDRTYAGVLQPDGKIVLAGYAHSNITNTTVFAAARLNSDGTPDISFHGIGIATVVASGMADQARCAVLQPDGKILLGGYVHSNNPNGAATAIVRLNANGIPDFTFDDDGIAVYENPVGVSSAFAGIALDHDGMIIATGFQRISAINGILLARVISGVTVGTKEIEAPVLSLSLFPNPVSEQLNLDYTLDNPAQVMINVYDLHGRLVRNLLQPVERHPGDHHETLSIGNSFSPGTYIVTLESKYWRKSLEIVIK